MQLRWLTVSLSAGAAIKGLPFVALLVYAAVIGPDDFAQVSMLALASAWLVLLASGGMEFASTYEERRRIANEPPISLIPAWYTIVPLSLVFALLFIGFALLVDFPIGPWLVMTICAVVLGLVQPELMGRARMRRHEGWLITFVVIPYGLATIVRLVALFGGFSSGISPLWLWVGGDVAAATILILASIPRIVRLHFPQVNREILASGWQTIKQSLPWMGTAGLQSALANVDKFILFPLVSAQMFGLYSLAYQLANIANVLASEYNKARLSSWVRQGVAGRTYSLVRESLHYLAVMVIGGIFAMIIAVVFRSTFTDVVGVCGLIVLALLPIAIYIPLENSVAIMQGRTMPLLWATAAGVLVCVIALVMLVGPLGILAGVVGTVAGYGATTWCLWRFLGNSTYSITSPEERQHATSI